MPSPRAQPEKKKTLYGPAGFGFAIILHILLARYAIMHIDTEPVSLLNNTGGHNDIRQDKMPKKSKATPLNTVRQKSD